MKNKERWQVVLVILSFVNPLRGSGILVALVATVVECAGQGLAWYVPLSICTTNLLAIRLISLIVMDTICFFIDTFLALWNHYQ